MTDPRAISGNGILSGLISHADERPDQDDFNAFPTNPSLIPALQLARMSAGDFHGSGVGNWPAASAVEQSPAAVSPIPVGYGQSTRPWWLGPPGPAVYDEWQRQFEKGTTGLYNFLRSFGGARSSSGGGNEDDCLDRWEKEVARCERFRPFGFRYYNGCRDRARDRHNLCIRNGGKPDPNEPDEYSFNDIPRDDPGR